VGRGGSSSGRAETGAVAVVVVGRDRHRALAACGTNGLDHAVLHRHELPEAERKRVAGAAGFGSFSDSSSPGIRSKA
jgi:hypothetical protein